MAVGNGEKLTLSSLKYAAHLQSVATAAIPASTTTTNQNHERSSHSHAAQGSHLTPISAPYDGEKVTSLPLKYAAQQQRAIAATIPANATAHRLSILSTSPSPHRVAQQPLRSKPHDGEKIATSPLKLRCSCKVSLPLPLP